MKIVQSFWSGNQSDINIEYGWNSAKYNWISWILSCHQLVKFYDEVELYTDSFGYEILINKLQLPYTKVHVVLDELNTYPKDLWAIAKIKTYSLQEKPFIHVDGDVFIWEKFPKDFINAGLLAQNLENTTGYYRKMWNDIVKYITYIPDELSSFHNGNSNLCCNMGIIGGTDISFFKEYCKKAFEFVDENFESWSKINLFNFNIFFEQELFYELTVKKSKKIDCLFEEIWKDNEYFGFGDFHLIPEKRTYLHLLGVFKRNSNICKDMEVYIMKNYPKSYSKLSKLINETNNSENEIDFLTTDMVKKLILEFETEIKNNVILTENFLLKRDLYNEGLSAHLEGFYLNKIDFKIILHSCFERKFVISDVDEFESSEIIEVAELNNPPRVYQLDAIDLLILEELKYPIPYFKFIETMREYFDEEDVDSNDEFLTLLNSRLVNYVILKIISIYN